MDYQSEKGYFFSFIGGKFRRVSSKNYPPVKGDKVKIIIKPYQKKITVIGIVKDVLTKKKYHSRGHKVRLESGEIGRIQKIF